MVKLTVIYNLKPGADHEEFIRWRTTEHHAANMSMPGIIKSDFYIIKEGWPDKETPYRYMTEAYWPDMDTFRSAFFETGFQERLKQSMQTIGEIVFLISEEVLTDVKDS